MKNKQAETIKQLTDQQLVYHLFLTQLILLMIALGLGVFLFEDLSAFFDLFSFTDMNIVSLGVPVGIVVVLFDWIMTKVTPVSYHDDGGINDRIFRNMPYSMIFIIALVVAICEETLFRGVIQTHIGLVWTSLIFAAVHYRYLFHWFLFLNVMVLSFLMGFMYEWTQNIVVTITAHFLIDFILALSIRHKHRNGHNGRRR